jgi:hypothetical protein
MVCHVIQMAYQKLHTIRTTKHGREEKTRGEALTIKVLLKNWISLQFHKHLGIKLLMKDEINETAVRFFGSRMQSFQHSSLSAVNCCFHH